MKLLPHTEPPTHVLQDVAGQSAQTLMPFERKKRRRNKALNWVSATPVDATDSLAAKQLGTFFRETYDSQYGFFGLWRHLKTQQRMIAPGGTRACARCFYGAARLRANRASLFVFEQTIGRAHSKPRGSFARVFFTCSRHPSLEG